MANRTKSKKTFFSFKSICIQIIPFHLQKHLWGARSAKHSSRIEAVSYGKNQNIQANQNTSSKALNSSICAIMETEIVQLALLGCFLLSNVIEY